MCGNEKGPWRAPFEAESSTPATTGETEPCQSEPRERQGTGLGHAQGGRHVVLFSGVAERIHAPILVTGTGIQVA